MSKFLGAYTALSAASPRSEVAAVLQSITDALPLQIDDAKRQDLIQTILDDLTKSTPSSGKSSKSRLSSKDATQALQAVKALGKNPAGSEVIASSANLSTLLALSQSYKDNMEASHEALRCIANALLLVEQARATFITKEVGGGEAVVELLEKSAVPERIFLASRILFLCTVSMASARGYIQTLVEAKSPGSSGNIVEIIGSRLDILSKGIMGTSKLAREAMTDLLKFTFNLLLHYPKIVDNSPHGDDDPPVMGDCWSDRLDGILPPLLRTFNMLPPTFPAPLAAPMTHIIHALITIPVNPSLRGQWFPRSGRSSTTPPSKSPSPRESPNSSPESSSKPALPTNIQSGSPTKDTKPGAFDRAWSALAAGRRSLSRSSSPLPHSSVDVLLRAYDLLDISINHYLPGTIDPDDSSVRERCRTECDQTLDDVLVPIEVLITKLCVADEGSRVRMRAWLFPDDLDRSTPLESHNDLLGRLLRILACVHHTRLKPATGEMLYAICDSDASLLASYVGYGNVAGFLFNKGITSAPPRSTASTAPTQTASGVPINPITGYAEQPRQLNDMTDEEKEREAEKLFVLFDRLEKTGAMPPSENPIRKAAQAGRLG